MVYYNIMTVSKSSKTIKNTRCLTKYYIKLKLYYLHNFNKQQMIV